MELHERRYPSLLVCHADGRPWVHRVDGFGPSLFALLPEDHGWFRARSDGTLRTVRVGWDEFLSRCRAAVAAGVRWATVAGPGDGGGACWQVLELAPLLERSGGGTR